MKIPALVPIVAAVSLFCLVPQAHAGVAQKDALQCVKIKDANKVLGGAADLFATPGCTLKGAATACVPVSVNADDDSRGGDITTVAVGYICFKAKCPGESPAAPTTLDTRFGALSVTGDFARGTKTICVPYN